MKHLHAGATLFFLVDGLVLEKKSVKTLIVLHWKREDSGARYRLMSLAVLKPNTGGLDYWLRENDGQISLDATRKRRKQQKRKERKMGAHLAQRE